MTEQHNLEDNI